MRKYEPKSYQDYYKMELALKNADYLKDLKGKKFNDVLRFRYFSGYRQASGSWYSISSGQPYNISDDDLKDYFDKGLVYSSQGTDIEGLYLAGIFEYTKKGPTVMVKLVMHRQITDADL